MKKEKFKRILAEDFAYFWWEKLTIRPKLSPLIAACKLATRPQLSLKFSFKQQFDNKDFKLKKLTLKLNKTLKAHKNFTLR